MVRFVQSNSSSQIDYYSDDVNDIQFALLGYWVCGE